MSLYGKIYEHDRYGGDCAGCRFRELSAGEIADPHRVTWDDYVERDRYDVLRKLAEAAINVSSILELPDALIALRTLLQEET